MVQAVNQFAMTPEQGMISTQFSTNVLPATVVGTQVGNLIPGQAVKIADVAGGPVKVQSLAADTDEPFGFVVLAPRRTEYAANQPLEIAFAGSTMYMTSDAAVARGAKVEFKRSNNRVITSAGTNPIVGIALDKATAAGQLIQVFILAPNYTAL